MIGDRLKALREGKCWSQARLATRRSWTFGRCKA